MIQPQIDKKKRTSTSGSRSKSKKSGNNIRPDQTVELKSKPLHIFHNHDICTKIKTENSLSVNKSKGSRKNSKSLKRPEKGSIKESKDQSYLVSAQRKYSVNKITKTEATHMQSQDIYKKLYTIKKKLNKLIVPSTFSISEIEEYFNQIKQTFSNVSLQPLQQIFQKLHTMYVTPIETFFDMIRPYQSILRKKEQISQMIKDQLQQNQKLYEQLDPQDIEIIRLKEKIQKNTEIIEQMKRRKKLQQNQFSMKKKKSPQNQTQTAKFVDISKQSNEFSEQKINQQQFQRKLVKQYEKAPVFHEQKKANFFKSETQNPKITSFSGALKNRAQKDSDQKDTKNVKVQTKQEREAVEQQEESLKPSEQNLDDEYLEEEPQSAQKNSQNPAEPPNKLGIKSGGMSFSFKLDIPKIDRSNVGFHDEFYSKLDEFSQSWRNQALREKRF